MMADNQLLNDDGVGGGGDVFVYTGGDQEVPRDVERVRIAENIDTIPAGTFDGCEELIEVEGHNKIKKIEEYAFNGCPRLRRVKKMTGVIEIEKYAFGNCCALSELDFDKLEIIGNWTFANCKSLKSISMPSVRRVGRYAFSRGGSTDVVFDEYLERIGICAFQNTPLRSIVIPLKDNLVFDNNTFYNCGNFSRVYALAGGIHRTMKSLHLESWRNEMKDEIDSINQTLPNTQPIEKAAAIQRWIARVLGRLEHYKSEHKALLKEAMTLLELALWKAKLLKETDEKKCNVNVVANKAKIDAEAARKEHRVTCGAYIVIKNVLPFLALK